MITQKIILYSHGFGVRKDDGGLFTDIATELNGSQHVMFDFNQINVETNAITVAPLDKQVELLRLHYNAQRDKHPDAIIDLICHSQGCVVAGLAKLQGIRKTILLAPPIRFLSAEAKLKQMLEREGTVVEYGVVSYPRKDGSKTIIKQDYWKSRDRVTDPITLYNELSQNAETILVNALNDEVLGKTDYSTISNRICVIDLDANHDFTGESRQTLLKTIRNVLGE